MHGTTALRHRTRTVPRPKANLVQALGRPPSLLHVARAHGHDYENYAQHVRVTTVATQAVEKWDSDSDSDASDDEQDLKM